MNWTNGEKGPECFCGMPTGVVVSQDGKRVDLMCIFHTYEAGAMFPLPRDKRPDNWPNLTNDEMQKLVEEGTAEQEAEEDS